MVLFFNFQTEIVGTEGSGVDTTTFIVVVRDGVRPETELVEVMQDDIGGLVAELACARQHDRCVLLGNRGQGVRRRGIKIAQVVG